MSYEMLVQLLESIPPATSIEDVAAIEALLVDVDHVDVDDHDDDSPSIEDGVYVD